MLDPGIDISLTTIRSRLDTIGKVLDSLLHQKDFEPTVYLFVSPEAYLLDDGIRALPEAVQKLQRSAGGRLKIVSCPNWGPYRKFVPYVQRYWGRNKIFVTADDDTIYPDTWLTNLYGHYREKKCVIGYRGHSIQTDAEGFTSYRSWMRSPIAENPGLSIVPTGKDGILYNTSFFPVSVLNMAAAMEAAPTADDLWLKWNFAYQGISTFLVHTDFRASTLAKMATEQNLYRDFNKNGGNDAAVRKIEAYFQENFGFSLLSRLRQEALSRAPRG